MAAEKGKFLELVLRYPSPHNGQPMRLLEISDNEFEVLFVTDRGLAATPISHRFSFVTIGVFFEYLQACGEALGHTVSLFQILPEEADMTKPGEELSCGTIKIIWNDIVPNHELCTAIEFRQTSRKKYTSGLSAAEKDTIEVTASKANLDLKFVEDDTARKTVWLNQRAVFDDMFNDDVRKELRQWMRTSHGEKVTKRDGLSYDCMEMSGSALKFSLDHYKVIRWPILSGLLKRYYIRTMRDDSSVAYISTPFAEEKDAYHLGRIVMRIWLQLSREGAYLHPFGTIVSNDAAHKDFVQLIEKQNESEESYIAFIFRAGRSVIPVRSERLPVEELIKGNS